MTKEINYKYLSSCKCGCKPTKKELENYPTITKKGRFIDIEIKSGYWVTLNTKNNTYSYSELG